MILTEQFSDQPNPIKVPAFMRTGPWEDLSFHFDGSARARLMLSDGRSVDVWVAEDDPKLREFPEHGKFTAYTYAAGASPDDGFQPVDALDSDNEAEIEAFIAKFAAE